MKLVPVRELKEGMVLAEDILGKYDIIYAASGTIITEKIISGFEKLNIEYVYVVERKDKKKEEVVIVDRNLNRKYQKTIDKFKDIYFNVKVGKKIIVDELENTVHPLVNEITKSNNILGRLRQIEITDEYTYKHSINVCLISTMIGKWIGLSKDELNDIALAGLLHDIGKSKIPERILNKPGKLTDKEFEVMKTHTTIGYEIVRNTSGINFDVQCGVLEHHERIDGKGYPLGLEGDKIHLYGKIISIADIYDAMTSNRVYRNKTSPFKVAELIYDNSFGHLDPYISNLFLKNIFQFYVGNIVKLNSGEIGEVILVSKYSPTRPLVKTSKGYIDLSKDYNYEIIDIIT